MTLLYAELPESDKNSHFETFCDGKKYITFFTFDDYRPVDDYEIGSSTPFHFLRVGDKANYSPEMLVLRLAGALSINFKFPFHTEHPVVSSSIDKYENIVYENINAILLDFGEYMVISTIVIPERNRDNDTS